MWVFAGILTLGYFSFANTSGEVSLSIIIASCLEYINIILAVVGNLI